MALFNCPKCGWRVKFTDGNLGKKGRCIQCAHDFVFPSTLTAPAAAAAAAKEAAPVIVPPANSGPALPWGKWLAAAAVLILVPAIVVACVFALRDAPKPVVFGKVTYKSKPLASGAISFQNDDRFSQTDIKADGSFEIVDAPIGQVKVSVRNVSTTLQKQKGDKIKWVWKSLIPTKYNDPERSGLRYTIGSGRQEINIDLKD